MKRDALNLSLKSVLISPIRNKKVFKFKFQIRPGMGIPGYRTGPSAVDNVLAYCYFRDIFNDPGRRSDAPQLSNGRKYEGTGQEGTELTIG